MTMSNENGKLNAVVQQLSQLISEARQVAVSGSITQIVI